MMQLSRKRQFYGRRRRYEGPVAFFGRYPPWIAMDTRLSFSVVAENGPPIVEEGVCPGLVVGFDLMEDMSQLYVSHALYHNSQPDKFLVAPQSS
jgi:hypothetical protein